MVRRDSTLENFCSSENIDETNDGDGSETDSDEDLEAGEKWFVSLIP